jgi:predicted alpha/beta superfamily hydrolase
MSEQYPRTALFGTEEQTLFCPTLGREYHLSVALPNSYLTSTQAYPVIYVLDGDLFFGMERYDQRSEAAAQRLLDAGVPARRTPACGR